MDLWSKLSSAELDALIRIADGLDYTYRPIIRMLTKKEIINLDGSITELGYSVINDYYKSKMVQKTPLPSEVGFDWQGYGEEVHTWRGEHMDVRGRSPEYWRSRFRLLK